MSKSIQFFAPDSRIFFGSSSWSISNEQLLIWVKLQGSFVAWYANDDSLIRENEKAAICLGTPLGGQYILELLTINLGINFTRKWISRSNEHQTLLVCCTPLPCVWSKRQLAESFESYSFRPTLKAKVAIILVGSLIL